MTTHKKITFEELQGLGYQKRWVRAVIVFAEDAFKTNYSFEERSYEVSRDNHVFCMYSMSDRLNGNCLDGKNLNIRLDRYIFDPPMWNAWKVDYCYILE